MPRNLACQRCITNLISLNKHIFSDTYLESATYKQKFNLPKAVNSTPVKVNKMRYFGLVYHEFAKRYDKERVFK